MWIIIKCILPQFSNGQKLKTFFNKFDRFTTKDVKVPQSFLYMASIFIYYMFAFEENFKFYLKHYRVCLKAVCKVNTKPLEVSQVVKTMSLRMSLADCWTAMQWFHLRFVFVTLRFVVKTFVFCAKNKFNPFIVLLLHSNIILQDSFPKCNLDIYRDQSHNKIIKPKINRVEVLVVLI